MLKVVAVTALIFTFCFASAAASGGSSIPAPPATGIPPRITPEQQAAERYNDGLKHIAKGDKADKEASAAKDPKQRARAEASARKEYLKAVEVLQSALEKAPAMFQAHGSLGYAFRKLGDYPAALKAYDKALELNAAYTPSIEYRAEAYLGLNRVDDAKSAYMDLFNSDRKRAAELTDAMKSWLEKRRRDPQGVAPETLEQFATWLSQREEIAGRTSALTDTKGPRW
jgi:tetratricopeptide (TPR) repeat protein